MKTINLLFQNNGNIADPRTVYLVKDLDVGNGYNVAEAFSESFHLIMNTLHKAPLDDQPVIREAGIFKYKQSKKKKGGGSRP